VIKKLNPPQRFPEVNAAVRAFEGVHTRRTSAAGADADEYYRLILNIDMGGQYFFREKPPGAAALSSRGTEEMETKP
jgi:hypothetical protein